MHCRTPPSDKLPTGTNTSGGYTRYRRSSLAKSIIVRPLKYLGYVDYYKSLDVSIFGLILKINVAATGVTRWSSIILTPQPLRAVRILFSPVVSGWVGRRAVGRSFSGLYRRNL